MDLSTIKDLYVGSTPAQSVWLGGTKVWERKHAVDILSIFDAMVLWYDPKRQGATNENMAENPVLTDLSGNGHDATCYNFEWTENSGISSTSYPNALVADGVDDYVKVEGLPILTDYTVIARRHYIEINKDTCLASKAISANVGAFIFEEKYLTNLPTVYSFGKSTGIQINENEIVYMTPVSYNGVSIDKGSSVDTNTLYLGTLCNDTRKFNGALYSFILFNRTLTEEEINWVKDSLSAEWNT